MLTLHCYGYIENDVNSGAAASRRLAKWRSLDCWCIIDWHERCWPLYVTVTLKYSRLLDVESAVRRRGGDARDICRIGGDSVVCVQCSCCLTLSSEFRRWWHDPRWLLHWLRCYTTSRFPILLQVTEQSKTNPNQPKHPDRCALENNTDFDSKMENQVQPLDLWGLWDLLFHCGEGGVYGMRRFISKEMKHFHILTLSKETQTCTYL